MICPLGAAQTIPGEVHYDFECLRKFGETAAQFENWSALRNLNYQVMDSKLDPERTEQYQEDLTDTKTDDLD